jgi:putative two-component system response regulator
MSEETLKTARILIVDDEPSNVLLLQRMLEKDGYHNLRSVTDPRQAVPAFTEFGPDLILLDLHMPGMDGVAVLSELRPRLPVRAYVPVLVLTADTTPEAKVRALSAGAKDFLSKPFDRTEVLLRIRNLLETRRLHRQLEGYSQMLEERVRERTAELEQARTEILERLALAAEYRDDDTHQHIQRVGKLSAELAEALEFPEELVELIRQAAPLHDIGKIGIPDSILLKPGGLTPDEFDMMKTHATIGSKILGGSGTPLLQLAEEIARTHHERWDGSGYPAGLAGQAIPIAGRIVAVADVFDALTHERPYKEAWPVERALEEIERGSGKQFDPRVVETFLRLEERLKASVRQQERPTQAPPAPVQERSDLLRIPESFAERVRRAGGSAG